jgi:hypothetical protein
MLTRIRIFGNRAFSGTERASQRDWRPRVDKPLKASLVMLALTVAGGAAQSRSLQIMGTAGYLSEWEFNGTVTEKTSAGRVKFFGPLIWKHVGVCSVNGPQEKYGEIRFQLSRLGSLSQINATISLDGAQCSYNGDFAGSSSGRMDCSDAKGVPLSILIK